VIKVTWVFCIYSPTFVGVFLSLKFVVTFLFKKSIIKTAVNQAPLIEKMNQRNMNPKLARVLNMASFEVINDFY